ncbi:MAG: four helix bundle protein [Polyangiaceae bacterium]|jgi:hypothetical protein|nr:four helix bundle protein [Polyangiaceae bacterium]
MGPPLVRNSSSAAPDTIGLLSSQRLDVCPRAIEFPAFAYDIVVQPPKGHADRADQLVRAAESVVRNIAQGAGRWSEAGCAVAVG